MPVPPSITKAFCPIKLIAGSGEGRGRVYPGNLCSTGQISGDTNKLVPLCREQQLLPPGQPPPKMPLSAQIFVWTHISHIITTMPVQPRKKQPLPSLLWWNHTSVHTCSPPPPSSCHWEQWYTACSCNEVVPQTEGTAQERANKHQKEAPNPQTWVCTAVRTHLGRLLLLQLPVLEAWENRAGKAPCALPPSQHYTHSLREEPEGHTTKTDWKASNTPQLKGEDWLEIFLKEFNSFETRMTCFK